MDISDNDHQSAQYNLTPYASADTVIRFIGTDDGHIHFDDIQIVFDVLAQNTYRQSLAVDQLHAKGITGQGIGVAVIDSGVSAHTDFVGRLYYYAPDYADVDVYGHGTHVAGILGSDGSASSGAYKGIAPDANIISLQVADANGMAYRIGCGCSPTMGFRE